MKERGRMEYGEGYGARLWCEGCARHARSPMAEVAIRVGGCEGTMDTQTSQTGSTSPLAGLASASSIARTLALRSLCVGVV